MDKPTLGPNGTLPVGSATSGPSLGLPMSMAIRLDHGLAVPGYYDAPRSIGGPASALQPTHAQRIEAALGDMRKAWEEVTGRGFYTPDREAYYVGLATAAGPVEPSA